MGVCPNKLDPILPSQRDILKETLVTVTEGNQRSKKRAI